MIKHLFRFCSKKTIFDQIIQKSIPSKVAYEDDHIYAFHDINPVAPVHILIIPKNKNGLDGIHDAAQHHVEILGKMLYVAKKIAKQQQLQEGYRLVINEGKHGQQTVEHLHMHLLGGRQMKWPPG